MSGHVILVVWVTPDLDVLLIWAYSGAGEYDAIDSRDEEQDMSIFVYLLFVEIEKTSLLEKTFSSAISTRIGCYEDDDAMMTKTTLMVMIMASILRRIPMMFLKMVLMLSQH